MSSPDTLRFIAIEALRPSPFNPRRTFAPEALADLKASINAVGILTPLIARPHPKDVGAFELAAGHRRFAVASELNLPTVPVIVREYSDDELREVLIIENLQRADVHPLEEADALQALVDAGRTVGQIAERIGRDVRFVKRRLALRNLAPEARRLLEEEKISLGVAQVLATVSRERQSDVIDGFDIEGEAERGRPTSVAAVIDAITDDSHVLAKARWDLTDATLHKPAGACSTCPKRTGAQVELLPEIAGDDRCLDSDCYETKGQKYSARVLVELQRNHKRVLQIWKPTAEAAKGKAPDVLKSWNKIGSHGLDGWYPTKKDAPGAVPAVIRDGSDVGLVQWLGRNPASKPVTSGTSSNPADEAKRKRELAARTKVVESLAKALLAKLPVDLVKSNVTIPLLRIHQPWDFPSMDKVKDLNGLLHLLLRDVIEVVVDDVNVSGGITKDEDLTAVAKVLKVDLAPFQAQYDELVQPPAPKAPAKPKSTAKAKPAAATRSPRKARA